MIKRDDLEADVLNRIENLRQLQNIEKAGSEIIEKYCGNINVEDVKILQYTAIFNRFFLYFCAMPTDLQNKCLVKMLDRHVPEPGDIYQVNA